MRVLRPTGDDQTIRKSCFLFLSRPVCGILAPTPLPPPHPYYLNRICCACRPQLILRRLLSPEIDMKDANKTTDEGASGTDGQTPDAPAGAAEASEGEGEAAPGDGRAPGTTEEELARAE